MQMPKGLQSWTFGGRVATGLGIGCSRTNAVTVRNIRLGYGLPAGRARAAHKVGETSPERGSVRCGYP